MTQTFDTHKFIDEINKKSTRDDSGDYVSLMQVFDAAFSQASTGKGRERHAKSEPFEKQKICEITRRLAGSPVAGPLFQAIKKCYESERLPKKRAIAELYGAINYIAAAIIVLEEQPEPEGTSE